MSLTTLACIFIGLYILVIGCCLCADHWRRHQLALIRTIYGLIFGSTIAQSIHYAWWWAGDSPDESAHISYILYLHRTGKLIPEFENMHLISGEIKWSGGLHEYVESLVNYVCHPPLYYQIMRLAGGFYEAEDGPEYYYIDDMRLRYFSLIIFAVALAVILYVGYSRLTHDRCWLHLMYATAVTSVPMMAYEGCAVTNDTLALLTGALSILGLIRFSEKKRNYGTYILIAVGITASLLTKMTTAMLVIIMAVLVLLFCMVKERTITGCLKKEFWITAPIYCIAIAYIAYICWYYGSIQVSLEQICSHEYFISTSYYVDPAERIIFTKPLYAKYYWERFFTTWTSICGTSLIMTKTPVFGRVALALELTWLFPIFIAIPAIYRRAKRLALPIFAGWVACVLTALYQFRSAFHAYCDRGYLGGNQARYYIPFLICFALALSFILESLLQSEDTKRGRIVNNIVQLVALGYSFMLFYGNFPYYLLHLQW